MLICCLFCTFIIFDYFYPGRPQDPRCEQQQPAQRQRQGPAGQDRARVQGLGLHQLHLQEVRGTHPEGTPQHCALGVVEALSPDDARPFVRAREEEEKIQGDPSSCPLASVEISFKVELTD